ncbi:MAG: nitroreductase family protein [Endomicrobium sp.]|jgi:nitroreductase|nr:nitroreductase family protein [Endomicrobium sp.]
MEDILFSRRSIREYINGDVSEKDLNYILHAAMAAPTAMNTRCYSFLVIKDKNMHKKIAMQHESAKMIISAPLAILVVGDSNIAFKGFLPQDCAAATQNILLAATARGYGTVWCGIYSNLNKEVSVAKLFNLPKNIKPFSLVVIGKTNVKPIKRNVWQPEKVKYETWNK